MPGDQIRQTHVLLRSAVIEHLFQWWARDGLLHRRLRLPDGRISSVILRQIARAYGVSRGILEGQEEAVGELVLSRLNDWPNDLVGRAKLVRSIAEEAKDRFTRGLCLSAFSKLVWFVRPEGWTLYDSYARAGLNAPRHGDDFDSFYHRLECIGFQSAMDDSREEIQASRFAYLHPERIHDVYLMLCNPRQDATPPLFAGKSCDDVLHLWSQFHGPEIVAEVEDLVSNLAARVTDHPAFQVHTKRDD